MHALNHIKSFMLPCCNVSLYASATSITSSSQLRGFNFKKPIAIAMSSTKNLILFFVVFHFQLRSDIIITIILIATLYLYIYIYNMLW